MKKRIDSHEQPEKDQVEGLIGFGSHSARKSYYPELAAKIEELQVEKDRYKTIFDNAIHGIFQARLHRGITVANPAMARICGYDSPEELPLHIYDLNTQLFDNQNDYKLFLDQLIRDKRIVGMELKWRKKDGTALYVSLDVQLYGEDDEKYLEGFVQDITRTREREIMFSAIFNSTFQFMGLLNREGVLMEANRTALDFVGISGDYAGKKFWEYPWWKEEDKGSLKEAVYRCANGEFVRFETFSKGFDKTIVVDFSLKPIFNEDGEVLHLVAEARDITERKKAENELSKLNEALEDRIAQRTIELQTSLDNLKKTQKQLVESEKMASLGGLVAGVAHEVNTPLGVGITGVSHFMEKVEQMQKSYKQESLTREDFEQFIGSVNEFGKVIMTQLSRAASLIQSFKQIAVEQGNDERFMFTFRPHIEKIARIYRKQLAEKQVTVEIFCDDQLTYYGYPVAFDQIIESLISNSLYHAFEMQDGGKIIITIKQNSDGIQIVYSDDGKGVSDNKRNKIFDPFYTTQRGQGRIGLGLHIVYNLVCHKFQGSVQCDPLQTGGLQFTILFPT